MHQLREIGGTEWAWRRLDTAQAMRFWSRVGALAPGEPYGLIPVWLYYIGEIIRRSDDAFMRSDGWFTESDEAFLVVFCNAIRHGASHTALAGAFRLGGQAAALQLIDELEIV